MTAIAAPRPAPVGRLLPVGLVAGGLFFGLLAAQLSLSGRIALVLGFGVLLLPVLLWLRPDFGPVLLMGAGLAIDQFPALPGPQLYGLTEKIPLFHGLGGYRPSDLLLLLLLLVYLCKRGATVAAAPRTTLARAAKWFAAATLFALFYGVGTGGVAPVALTEARPFLYLVAAYLVTASFLTTRRSIERVLWTLVIVEGARALQALVLFASVRTVFPRPESILGHEESLLFGLFVLLTAGLWLYGVEGKLRRTATWLLPLVIMADLVNGRRTAWLILPAGLMVVAAIGIVTMPERRRSLSRVAVVVAIFSAFYFPAYWNKTGGLAQPARAFHSAVAPDPRDASSNLYRVQENENLKYNIRMNGPVGRGFGHRIVYALPIVDISDIDPYIAYIPHNGVWWVFLRFGVAGTIAFWTLLGMAALAACRLAKVRDRSLAVVGMLGACAVPTYALLGYNDQGFFYFRVAFVVGVLFGMLEAARRVAEEEGAA